MVTIAFMMEARENLHICVVQLDLARHTDLPHQRALCRSWPRYSAGVAMTALD